MTQTQSTLLSFNMGLYFENPVPAEKFKPICKTLQRDLFAGRGRHLLVGRR